MGQLAAAFTLGALLLTGGSCAICPGHARAAGWGELTDKVTGPAVDRLLHRPPSPVDLEEAARHLSSKPPVLLSPEASVLKTPSPGAFETLLGNDKALAVIDFGAQMVGVPPGTVQAMASLIVWLMEADRVAVELTPDQQALLRLAQANFGTRCGPYVTLASLQNIQPIDPSARDAEVFCKLLGNGAVLAREYAHPPKR